MTYVLIVITAALSHVGRFTPNENNNRVVQMQEFASLERCERAAAIIRGDKLGAYVLISCEPK